MTRLKWYLDPPSPHKLKKKVIKVGPPLTKFSGFPHVISIQLNKGRYFREIMILQNPFPVNAICHDVRCIKSNVLQPCSFKVACTRKLN